MRARFEVKKAQSATCTYPHEHKWQAMRTNAPNLNRERIASCVEDVYSILARARDVLVTRKNLINLIVRTVRGDLVNLKSLVLPKKATLLA